VKKTKKKVGLIIRPMHQKRKEKKQGGDRSVQHVLAERRENFVRGGASKRQQYSTKFGGGHEGEPRLESSETERGPMGGRLYDGERRDRRRHEEIGVWKGVCAVKQKGDGSVVGGSKVVA